MFVRIPLSRRPSHDDWVHLNRVAGIEVYTEGTVPAQFQQGMSGCGSIVIWTK